MGDYLLDEFVALAPGDAIRLFPFGKLFKGGKVREITAELASKFKLPHFKPPIKLGGHADETPAGGFITGLQVRDDGLYAEVEFTDKGAKSIQDGDYRYHSPEVIWETGGLEDPKTGDVIEGPLIIGDALLHTPHLGEAAALYQIEPYREVEPMADYIEVPKGWFEKVMDFFKYEEPVKEPEPEPTPEPEMDVEKFAALEAEAAEWREKYEAQIAEQKEAERLGHFNAALVEAGVDIEDGAKMLASMTDEQADWVLGRFKALSAQVEEGELFEEKGSTGESLPENPLEKLNALVLARAEADSIGYNEAFALVRAENPDLFAKEG